MSNFTCLAYVDVHMNVTVEHRENEKALSHAKFSAAQARNFAHQLITLADMIDKYERGNANAGSH